IDGLLVDQERVDEAAHLNELVPIAIVASETRDFPGDDSPDLAEADFGDHSLETGSIHGRDGGKAEVLVDDLNVSPAERKNVLLHRVLKPATLLVVENLVLRRLADVYDGRSLEVPQRDLFTHRSPRASLSSDRVVPAVAPTVAPPRLAEPPGWIAN